MEKRHEVKKASPSKGLIAPDFPYVEIARQYQEAGADAVSVLTEPEFFLGADRYLEEIHGEIDLPLLRKDFTDYCNQKLGALPESFPAIRTWHQRFMKDRTRCF